MSKALQNLEWIFQQQVGRGRFPDTWNATVESLFFEYSIEAADGLTGLHVESLDV